MSKKPVNDYGEPMNSTEQCVANYINGNLKTAREQAQHETHKDLRETLEQYGYSEEKAQASADYLQTGEFWQQACNTP